VIYLIRYWKYVVAAVIVLSVCFACRYREQRSYRKGYNDATAKISAEIAKTAKKQAETAYAASLGYQEEKSEREKQERVRYVEVQKIIKQPVYRNVCLDDDGLRIINDSATGK